MAIHESLSLWCYHPLIGKKRVGYFYGGGSFDDSYFNRNAGHWRITCDYIEGLIKSRFVHSRNIVFLQHWPEYDLDWNAYKFNFLLDSCSSYPLQISVVVWCPAFLSPKAEGDKFVNNTTIKE